VAPHRVLAPAPDPTDVLSRSWSLVRTRSPAASRRASSGNVGCCRSFLTGPPSPAGRLPRYELARMRQTEPIGHRRSSLPASCWLSLIVVIAVVAMRRESRSASEVSPSGGDSRSRSGRDMVISGGYGGPIGSKTPKQAHHHGGSSRAGHVRRDKSPRVAVGGADDGRGGRHAADRLYHPRRRVRPRTRPRRHRSGVSRPSRSLCRRRW
jgi:hypothetical protein